MSEPVYGQCPRCGGPLVQCYCPKPYEGIQSEIIRYLAQRLGIPARMLSEQNTNYHGTRDTGWPRETYRLVSFSRVTRPVPQLDDEDFS